MTSSNADRLRIAIAIVALKHKPQEQSVASYILELRSKFLASQPSPPTSDASWRSRALELEGEVASLKAQVDAQELGRTTRLPVETEKHPEEPPKKKQKRKSANTVVEASKPESSLEEVMKSISSISDSESLLGAVTLFQNLTGTTNPSHELVSSVGVRTLDSISPHILRILDPTKLKTTTTSHQDTLRMLSTVSHHVLSTCLPLLTATRKKSQSDNTLDKLLDKCLSAFFLPAIKAFSPLSNHFVKAMLAPPSSKVKASVDIRPDLLHAIRTTINDLCSIPSMREALAIQTCRELHATLTAKHDIDERMRRIHNLARKDALWYLCSVLHLLFTSSGTPNKVDYLTDESMNALCRILMQFRSRNADVGSGMGEMEYERCCVHNVLEPPLRSRARMQLIQDLPRQ